MMRRQTQRVNGFEDNLDANSSMCLKRLLDQDKRENASADQY